MGFRAYPHIAGFVFAKKDPAFQRGPFGGRGGSLAARRRSDIGLLALAKIILDYSLSVLIRRLVDKFDKK